MEIATTPAKRGAENIGEVLEPPAERMTVAVSDSKPVLYMRLVNIGSVVDVGDDEKVGKMQWYKLEDLDEHDEAVMIDVDEDEEMLMNYKRPLTDMPPPFSQIDQPQASTVVGLGSFIFCIGGEITVRNFSEGEIGGLNSISHPTCSHVYCIDTSNLSTGWQRCADLRVARRRPHVVGIDGKLFVFGGLRDHVNPILEDNWAEVYDTKADIWAPLNISYDSKSMYSLLNPREDPFFNFGVARAPDNEFEIVFASRHYEEDDVYIACRYHVRTSAVRPDPAAYHFPEYYPRDTIGPYSYTNGIHTILHQGGGSYLVNPWYGEVSHMDSSSGLVVQSSGPFFKGLPHCEDLSDSMSAVIRSDSLPAHSPHANRLHLIWFGYHHKARCSALYYRSITYAPQTHSSDPCLVPIRQSTKMYVAPTTNCMIIDGLLLDSKMATEEYEYELV